MLKILIIAEADNKLTKTIPGTVVANVTPGAQAQAALLKHKPDLVVTTYETATLLNMNMLKATAPVRTSISASTHQGIQLVPISDVLYFQAEHKYVTAHHLQGELLIEDTIASLEDEFTTAFVRIHRKTLVAIAKIEQLLKNTKDQHYVKLRDSNQELIVSRRQLPTVRKVLLCK